MLNRCMGPEVIMAWEKPDLFAVPRHKTRGVIFHLYLTGNHLPALFTDIGSLGEVLSQNVADIFLDGLRGAEW